MKTVLECTRRDGSVYFQVAEHSRGLQGEHWWFNIGKEHDTRTGAVLAERARYMKQDVKVKGLYK